MEMEEKHDPNSHEHHRRDSPKSWSELPPDLLSSVFERLGFADFRQAKSVCSSWHSASKQSVPKNQIPWLIQFPEKDDDNNNNACTLFNPEVKDKLYKTQDLGLEFAKSVCVATYRSWLLMRDPLYNLYIVNLSTHERINLPPLGSQLGKIKVKRTLDDDWFLISNDHGKRKIEKTKGIDIASPVFWIDETTKDYVVIWGLEYWSVVYAKKGDTSWNQIPEISNCYHMVYKDHKLYFCSRGNSLRIFDFSGETPQQTFRCRMRIYINDTVPLSRDPDNRYFNVLTKFVVTVSGDVLGVDRRTAHRSGLLSFHVYMVYSSSSRVFKKNEQVDSLGDEAMLLDLGITVLANGIEGFKKNSIYFSIGPYHKNTTEICLFNLQTREMEPLHKFDLSSFLLYRARWFLPSFKRKCF